MKDNTWMGLVLGDSGMAPGSDMIQIKANGIHSRVYDKFSQGYISPANDREKDIPATFRFFEGGYIRFTLRRALDTGDTANDFLIPIEQEFDLGYAINDESNDLLLKHSKAGAVRALIKLDGTDSFEPQNLSLGAVYMVSGITAAMAATLTLLTF